MKGTVLIVGLGLIGGSLALAIKDAHPEAYIIGIDVSRRSLEQGKTLGIIDEMGESLQTHAPQADLIIFCCPVKETEALLPSLAKINLKESVLVTDTGSTKETIIKAAAPLIESGICFIGGHPMAGSHKSGVIAAKKRLFENAYYLLTPPKTEESNVVKLKKWLAGTNAKFLILTAADHDEITGMLSHVPHIIASALVNQTRDFTKKHPVALLLAAGGFRDLTRVASGDPRMWTDITLSNRDALMHQLSDWHDTICRTLKILKKAHPPEIYQFFEQAKEFRDAIPVHQGGAIPSFYDLFIEIPDYPGVISEVTAYLAREQISLTNVKILETREDINGVLQLSFQNEEDRLKAKRCLEKVSYYIVHVE